MKRKLFRYIVRLIGVKEGQEYPRWLLIIFYPIRYYVIFYSGFSFDFASGIYLIEGVRIHESFFKDIAKGLPEGCHFKFVKRENETVYIERLPE